MSQKYTSTRKLALTLQDVLLSVGARRSGGSHEFQERMIFTFPGRRARDIEWGGGITANITTQRGFVLLYLPYSAYSERRATGDIAVNGVKQVRHRKSDFNRYSVLEFRI